MQIELWSEQCEIGEGCTISDAVHVFVPDALGLSGNVDLVEFFRQQISCYSSSPRETRVVVENKDGQYCVQFVVDAALFVWVRPRFNGIITDALFHFS